MTIYAAVLNGAVVGYLGSADPVDFVGPPTPPPDVPYDCYQVADKGSLTGPTPTSRLMWNNGSPTWVETTTLGDLVTAAVAKCYPDIDAIYADAVGNRTEEYRDAESDARAFKAAGYAGTASDYVHDFALHNPTGTAQTDQWAADQIIARADAFASAKLSMRSQRFASQAAMRAAATDADLNAAVSAWNSFIATTRQNLGLPPAP